MNKKISFLLLCVLVALTLILPCSADESELVTDIVTETVDELVTDVETAPEVDAPAVDNTVDNTVTDAPTEEAVADEWEVFKAKITDSATWTMIGTALVTILVTIGTVASKFKSIASLVHNKADNDTLKGAIKELEQDIKAAYNSNHKEVSATMARYEEHMKHYREALKNTEENEQRLYAILTLFMTNCKISDSAKAEILNILADVKKYDGDIIEVVSQAQEAIDKEVEEQLKIAEPTPTLDKLLEEEYMDLG
jgi:oligoendopeptidase F